MSSLTTSLILATLAGATIPLGAHAANFRHIQSNWLEQELRHSVIAFGGGVLLAAVSLVLVPEGIKGLTLFWIVLVFALGGIAFFLIDRLIAHHGGRVGQFMAMLLDFVPEAMALGAALATNKSVGVLLALLIALQNFPEGFNAFRELTDENQFKARRVLRNFWLLVLIGPLAALIGHEFLSNFPALLSAIMLFSASGIIYLTFEDIAPRVILKKHWAPPLGAVAGFLAGLIGHVLII